VKQYTSWVVKLYDAEYFTGDAYGDYPYDVPQKTAAKFLTKELAEAAIAPRIAVGLVSRSSLRVHRLYRNVEE